MGSPPGRKKALFLDRDGVVNVEKHYAHKAVDIEFMAGVFDLCGRFQSAGYTVVVVTNQAGIARGYYTERDVLLLHEWMQAQFAQRGVTLSAIYHCPHHPDFSGDCECRKPKPGMILQARDDLDLDLSRSVLLGDKDSDLEAGRRAGVRHLGLVHGLRSLESIDLDGVPTDPDHLPSLLPEWRS